MVICFGSGVLQNQSEQARASLVLASVKHDQGRRLLCCRLLFEHSGGVTVDQARRALRLVPSDPDRGGTCPCLVSRCCGVIIPLAWWRETALWWAAGLWSVVWVGGVTTRATAALAAHSPFRNLSALPPQLCRITSAAVPKLLRTTSALLPHCFRTASALLPHCFRSCFRTCFRTASALLPHCFCTASALLLLCNDVIRPVIKSAGARRRLRSWEAV